MRIVFLTSEFEFGERSLPALLEQGEDIQAVVMPPAPETNRRAERIKALASEGGIAVHETESLRDPTMQANIRNWQGDLAVSAGNMRYIFNREFRESFTLGAINFHASLLPKNGGACPIHWQIYKGEERIGMTIHHCAQGIDTGDIILQDSVPLGPDDTFKSIYFPEVLPRSVALLSRAVRLFREGRAPRAAQDLSQSTYNPPFGEVQATITWSDPVEKIYNVVRACDAWPGARTTYRGRLLKIWQARKTAAGPAREPGTIMETGKEGLLVSAPQGGLFIQRVQLEGEPKQMTPEFLAQHDMKVGERLGH